MPKIEKYPSGTISVRQTWQDLEELNAMLEESPPLGDVASYLMASYFKTLYQDSGTTFGEIVGGFLDPHEQYAGFTFRDSDSNNHFELLVKHEHDSYRHVPPVQDLYAEARRLEEMSKTAEGVSFDMLLIFARKVHLNLAAWAKTGNPPQTVNPYADLE